MVKHKVGISEWSLAESTYLPNQSQTHDLLCISIYVLYMVLFGHGCHGAGLHLDGAPKDMEYCAHSNRDTHAQSHYTHCESLSVSDTHKVTRAQSHRVLVTVTQTMRVFASVSL